MVDRGRLAIREEIESAIRETLEESGGVLNLADIYDVLAGQYPRDQIRSGISNLRQEGRIVLTLGEQFGLPE